METSLFVKTVERLPSLSISILIATTVLYLIGDAIYNLFFHPLAKYPGPIFCRISKLPWDYWQWTGRLPQHTATVHRQYGEVVRLAPNELSFANAQAWNDIYANLRGRDMWPRHPRRVPQGKHGPMSIMNTAGSEHARFRKLLNHAFSEKGLQEQQGRISKYINLFVHRISEFAKTGESVDLKEWYQMVGFDIISDLGWNEPFNCVERGESHSWMKTFVTTFFDSQLKFLFREHGILYLAPYFIPKRIQMDRLNNFKYAGARIEERIKMGGSRGDFWDRVMIKSADDNLGGEGLTKEEMIVTAVTLVGTGSETASTLLTGLVWFLGNNPQCMKKFVEEIRAAFASPDDINMVSVQGLKYMTAAVQETMRLYPPVITMLWRVPPAGGGRACGETIPEGTSVNMSFLGIAQNPAYFHRPDDFVPERWLSDAPAEFTHDNKAAFRPFSVGAMNCLGQNLANSESRLILAKMFLHYDLEIDYTRTVRDWMDQKAWAVFVKKSLYVKFKMAR